MLQSPPYWTTPCISTFSSILSILFILGHLPQLHLCFSCTLLANVAIAAVLDNTLHLNFFEHLVNSLHFGSSSAAASLFFLHPSCKCCNR